MSDELPEGWASTTLGQLLTGGIFADGDWVESKDQDPDGDTRLVQLADVGDGIFRNRSARFLTSQKVEELGCTVLQKGDVLIARMPSPLGRACTFPGDSKPCVTVVDVCIARPTSCVADARWLMHAINAPQFRGKMEAFERGTTRKRISRANLSILPLSLPPIAEQRRIVAKVEALLARVNAARERLEKVPLLLKRFRQSMLAKAFRGELVPTEADLAAREGRAFQSAAQLLGRPDSAVNEDLPEGWALVNLFDLCSPKQWPTISTKQLLPSGYPVYGANGRIGFYSNFNHEKPTLLITCRGATCGTLNICESFAYVNGNAMALDELNESDVDMKFLLYALKSRGLQDAISGSAQPQITRANLAVVNLGIPPLGEQHRIVAKVEALLSLADALEHAMERARAKLTRAPQAILSRAFAGELVPTEAELAAVEGHLYESAEELLRRATESGAPKEEDKEKQSKRRNLPRKTAAVGT